MSAEITDFSGIILQAYDAGVIKKLIFSRPKTSEVKKISARLAITKRGVVLALEYSLPSGTVSQKNLTREAIPGEICGLLDE